MTANPIFVALDTPELEKARAMAMAVRDQVGGLKLGLEFFMAQGPAGVRALADIGLPIFLDVKLHDIPNTVAGAMRSLSPLGLAIVNVHGAGAGAMMAAAREAMAPSTKVIAVTVLTSLGEEDVKAIGIGDGATRQVERLADLARASGLDGVVCSPVEVVTVRSRWDSALIVVPGIRPAGSALGDQTRVGTPRDTLQAGASILVVGRPITAAADPAEAAAAIAASLR